MQDEAIRFAGPYPAGRFSGRGIVMVAGGAWYFTCAWVSLTILRRVLGCSLPIQIWYLGPDEMSRQMAALLEPFGVECVDAFEVRRLHPVRRLGGWECKPYAILHSPFKQVILLDADNVPLVDPAMFLSGPEHRCTGAIFWPDIQGLAPESAIWEVCRVPFRDEPAFEAGQIVVDKERCWTALQLTMHLNERSDFYYQHVNGDKESFHMAWRMLEQPYSMPDFPVQQIAARSPYRNGYLPTVLQQHDFEGRATFQHRTGAKWSLLGENASIEGFEFEDLCLEALRDLRQRWNGRIASAAEAAGTLGEDLVRTRYLLYCRIGYDQRLLEFIPGGQIGHGKARCEQTWGIEQGESSAVLVIGGDGEETCRLHLDPDGIWRGRWLQHERMPVELIPPDRIKVDRTGRAE
jgi:hypothetical protein